MNTSTFDTLLRGNCPLRRSCVLNDGHPEACRPHYRPGDRVHREAAIRVRVIDGVRVTYSMLRTPCCDVAAWMPDWATSVECGRHVGGRRGWKPGGGCGWRWSAQRAADHVVMVCGDRWAE